MNPEQKCRDCAFTETEPHRGEQVMTCTKGHWNRIPGVPHWYSVSTVKRNRLPMKAIGPRCKDFPR